MIETNKKRTYLSAARSPYFIRITSKLLFDFWAFNGDKKFIKWHLSIVFLEVFLHLKIELMVF